MSWSDKVRGHASLEGVRHEDKYRPTIMWSVEPGAQEIRVYADEVQRLNDDAMLYGNVFVRRNADKVFERCAPVARDC